MHIASEFTGRVQLSVFPYLLDRLLHARHECPADISQLSKLVRTDPALCFMTMRLDRWMESTPQATNYPGIDEVVSRIGMAGIDAITNQALVDQALNGVHHQQGLALGWLWRHSLTTALLAQGMALELNMHPVEEVYIAGLLHDIGKLALYSRTPAACVPMLADPAQAKPLLEAEEQVVGSDHCRIGERLIHGHTGAWFAADAARYHTVTLAEVKNALPMVQVVWSANLMAGMHATPEAIATVAGLLNLQPRQLDRLSKSAEAQAQSTADEFGVTPSAPEVDPSCDEYTVPLKSEIQTSTVLSSVYSQLLKATDQRAIMLVLRQSLCVFLGLDTLVMLDHAPQESTLIGRFTAGNVLPWPTNRLRIPLTAEKCLPAICHGDGETVDSFSRERQGKLTIIDRQLMAYMQKEGIVCLPVDSGTGVGPSCLLLGIDRADWPWIQQQISLLKAITAAVAGALNQQQRHGVERHRRTADSAASAMSRTRKIVHEINNPLSIIKNYLKVLMLRTDDQASDQKELRIINEEINRVAGLIKSLTSPAGKVPIHYETVDVNTAIMDIVTLFRKGLPEKTAIHLNQDLDVRIPAVVADRNWLKQALMNLLKNAMEAMPEGGSIHIRTRMLRGTPRHDDRQDAASHVKISICDDGPGIDERIENDLFKPHVTSKKDHDGLGLSIVHEAMTHLKGSLLCESVPGQGTCFHIELPAGNQ